MQPKTVAVTPETEERPPSTRKVVEACRFDWRASSRTVQKQPFLLQSEIDARAIIDETRHPGTHRSTRHQPSESFAALQAPRTLQLHSFCNHSVASMMMAIPTVRTNSPACTLAGRGCRRKGSRQENAPKEERERRQDTEREIAVAHGSGACHGENRKRGQ